MTPELDSDLTPAEHERLGALAAAFTDLQAAAFVDGTDTAAQRLVELAVDRVPGARWASMTELRDDKPRTVASSDPIALQADQIQYDVGSGPCLDAITDDTIYQPGDLRNDDRWPEFGRRVADELGMASMLCYRLSVDGGGLLGGLNMYSDKHDAFGDESRSVGLLLATHAAAVLEMERSSGKATNLAVALESSREIGTAMGVLMATLKVTREQAFDLLRVASQHTHRKLRDVASEVADTGALDLAHLPPAH